MASFIDSALTASVAETTLNKIAAALDCSASAFFGPSSGALAETDELLRLWSQIEHEQDRAKVLAYMRSVAPAATAQQER